MMRALCHYPHRRPAFGPSCTEFVYPACWHIEIGATSKIDDVLTEHGGLLHVLPLAVHLSFFLLDKQGDHSEPFLLFEILVSPKAPWFLVFGAKGLGPGLDNS